MRIVIASMLAVLLLGGSVTAQSPEASLAPLPSTPAASAPAMSPGASPGASTLPGVMVKVHAASRATCPTNAMCSWYLTLIGASMPGGVFVTPMTGLLNAAGTRTVLTPTAPLPSPLAPGTYLVEASAWIQADVAAANPPKAKLIGRSASCGTIVTVSADGSDTTADLAVAFRKDGNGCTVEFLYTETDLDNFGN